MSTETKTHEEGSSRDAEKDGAAQLVVVELARRRSPERKSACGKDGAGWSKISTIRFMNW